MNAHGQYVSGVYMHAFLFSLFFFFFLFTSFCATLSLFPINSVCLFHIVFTILKFSTKMSPPNSTSGSGGQSKHRHQFLRSNPMIFVLFGGVIAPPFLHGLLGSQKSYKISQVSGMDCPESTTHSRGGGNPRADVGLVNQPARHNHHYDDNNRNHPRIKRTFLTKN